MRVQGIPPVGVETVAAKAVVVHVLLQEIDVIQTPPLVGVVALHVPSQK